MAKEITVQVSKVNIPLIKDEDLGSFSTSLYNAVKSNFQTESSYVSTKDIFPNYVIFRFEDRASDSAVLYKSKYIRDLDTGMFEFETPIAVRKVISYEEIL